MNLNNLQEQLRTFADERDWGQFHTPKNLSMALSVESSELVEIFQWLTPEQSIQIMNSDQADHVGEEVADIMIYLARFCDQLNIDLNKVVQDKIVKNSIKHTKSQK